MLTKRGNFTFENLKFSSIQEFSQKCQSSPFASFSLRENFKAKILGKNNVASACYLKLEEKNQKFLHKNCVKNFFS